MASVNREARHEEFQLDNFRNFENVELDDDEERLPRRQRVGNWIYSHPIIFYAMTFVVCVAIVSALMFVIVSIMKSDVPGA